MQAATERQNLIDVKKKNIWFMVKTLKNLVQASSYIKTSVNNLREVTMLGMT